MEHEELLKQAAQIIYTQKQLWKYSGSHYNIFKSLRIETKEIRHSAFLADLLNPNGFHGLGNRFLKLFLDKIGFKDFSTDNAIVRIEETTTQNKRFDISIVSNDDSFKIIIENKIRANDSKNQIKYYLDQLKKCCKKDYKLVYLTLYGEQPQNSELTDEDFKYVICLSYKNDIIEILKTISTIENNLPFPIIELIREYILTIKELTNQGVDSIMSTRLEELLLKDENMITVEELYRAKEELRENTFIRFLELLFQKLSEKEAYIINKQQRISEQNIKELANSYLSCNNKWIIIRFSLEYVFPDNDFQIVLTNEGELWEQIIIHTDKYSNTVNANLDELYKQNSAHQENNFSDIHFKDKCNERFIDFAKFTEEEQEESVSKFVERIDSILNMIKKN